MMKYLVRDVPDDVYEACRIWHNHKRPAMFQIARKVPEAEVDLMELLAEVKDCREEEPKAKFSFELGAVEIWANKTNGRMHAEHTVKFVIVGAKMSGVPQWKIKSILSEIYGDTF